MEVWLEKIEDSHNKLFLSTTRAEIGPHCVHAWAQRSMTLLNFDNLTREITKGFCSQFAARETRTTPREQVVTKKQSLTFLCHEEHMGHCSPLVLKGSTLYLKFVPRAFPLKCGRGKPWKRGCIYQRCKC